MNDYLLLHGAKKEQLVCIPNGAEPQPKRATYHNALRVIYAGNFAFWEDVDAFLDTVKLSGSGKYEFYLAGTGDLKDHVENRIKTENLNLKYLGSVPKDRIMGTLADMQVGVAPSVSAVTRRVACPIKVFDYLACGLPVITPDYGEWATVIKEDKCGVVTERSTGEQFGKALEKLSDRQTWEEMSHNAVALIKTKWNWETLLEPIQEVLKRIQTLEPRKK
jgi:glycosyltransferase involved in cell wall biosynthesis